MTDYIREKGIFHLVLDGTEKYPEWIYTNQSVDYHSRKISFIVHVREVESYSVGGGYHDDEGHWNSVGAWPTTQIEEDRYREIGRHEFDIRDEDMPRIFDREVVFRYCRPGKRTTYIAAFDPESGEPVAVWSAEDRWISANKKLFAGHMQKGERDSADDPMRKEPSLMAEFQKLRSVEINRVA